MSTVFGADRPNVDERDEGVVATLDGLVAEADSRTGGIWATDRDQLWNESLRPSLISPKEAYAVAADLLRRAGVMPQFADDSPFALLELGAGRTVVATSEHGRRDQRELDVQARFTVTVRNPGVDGPDLLPVVGGGGKFKAIFGDNGRPIGLHGLWRPVADEEFVDALSPDEAAAEFREMTSGLKAGNVRSFLAYYAAPVGVEQDVLAPVYVFGGTIAVERGNVPMRLVLIPATEYGPTFPKGEPQPPRKRQPGRIAAALGAPRRAVARGNPFEAGTSWIGLSGGLAGSQANAQGFVDGLAADGWLVNFNWGDANAWESDWRRNDDTWVDAADFVFYTGHADMNGWTLASPDDGSLVFNEVGSAPAAASGDLWGRQDLEWAIVAACGPLQDEVLAAGGGDVLARWDGAFDGLHILMGYGAITFDNTEEGKRIVKYARQGTPLIDAWFRTAQEIQPSTNGAEAPDGPDVWVGAMWVAKSGADPRSDRLWGHGAVSADPTSPTSLACMWTTC
ncbi:MAG: hypothetical protein ICV64_04340 [Thermoleophilia bacterium]|nr:hypothetical protein [Thermoleophilia bacterium]